MLRSFEYTEIPYDGRSFQSEGVRKQESEIVHKFLETHKKKSMLPVSCPMCGNSENGLFYEKMGVPYYRCDRCNSIFVPCFSKDVEEYKMNSELIAFRTSESYQKEMTERRMQSWNDFLEWMEVRCFRFMKRNKGLSIVDVGNRYQGYVDLIKNAPLCGEYNLRESILSKDEMSIEQADLIFYLDQMQQELQPQEQMEKLYAQLSVGGLLVVGTRVGSGFDILTLKENNSGIYPYEHVMLPTIEGLSECMRRAGFEILEVTTPGVMDVQYVLENRDKIHPDDAFVSYLMNHSEDSMLHEFQRFLQKSGLSSFARIIARKGKTE